MIKKSLVTLSLLLAGTLTAGAAGTADAFQGAGCMGECTDCHTINKEEAGKLLKTDRFNAEIKDIRMSPVKGLWQVEVVRGDKTFLVYIDFAKQYLVEGRFTALEKLSEGPTMKTVDVASVPLESAVLLGKPDAPIKLVVFDDPECPYCIKLHGEIKKVLEQREDVAFYVKLYPLAIHPDAYAKSKAILCAKDPAAALDETFAGKDLGEADCETEEVDNNIKLANELGIKGTPAIIFPDGRLLPGYVPADVLINLLEGKPEDKGAE